jgi:hypothetical protein
LTGPSALLLGWEKSGDPAIDVALPLGGHIDRLRHHYYGLHHLAGIHVADSFIDLGKRI